MAKVSWQWTEGSRSAASAGGAEQAAALDALAAEQSGVAATAQVEEIIERALLRSHVRAGRWRRVCRGVVAMSNGRLDRAQQLWVAVLAAGPGALLAGVTAAIESGVRGLRAEPLEVLIPAGREVSTRLPRLPPDMPVVRIHRTTIMPDEHRRPGSPPRTTVARSVVDAAAWSRSPDEARATLAAACQQRLVRPSDVLAVVDVMPKVRHRKLIRTTLADIAGGAQALSELSFIELCHRHRLPVPDLQQQRRDAHGRIRYLDASWARWRLHAEIDGAHHMEVRDWKADMVRQNEIWIAGDRLLRFPATLLRKRPAEVAAQLRQALAAAGWHP